MLWLLPVLSSPPFCSPFWYAPPLPHAPGAEREQDTAAAERVLERIDGARTRKASKKAARKAQAEATAKEKSSRLQFTDEERATPELERYIRKSDKAADRLDAAKAAIPKEKKLVRERTFDEATGKGKTLLDFPRPVLCAALCQFFGFVRPLNAGIVLFSGMYLVVDENTRFLCGAG